MARYKNIVRLNERKRKHSIRDIINTIMYITKSGCQWRVLPSEFAPWQTVYFYFGIWKSDDMFKELMHHLRSIVRKVSGKEGGL